MTPTQALNRRFVMPGEMQTEPGDPSAGNYVQRYGFRIGDCQLLHDMRHAVELSELPPCCGLPNSSPWFRGLSNLRGNLVPVFDLAELLGVSNQQAQRKMLLVIGSGEKAAGLVIDGTPMQISIDTSHRVSDPEGVPALLDEHLQAAYEFGGDLWLEADFESLFGSLARRIDER